MNHFHSLKFLFLWAGCLGLVALACGGPAALTATPPGATPLPVTPAAVAPLAGTPRHLSTAELELPAVAPFSPAGMRSRSAVAPYPLELAAVTNSELLASLSGAQRAALGRHGFVVAPAPAANFDDIYRGAQAAGQPIYVTSDVLLHTFWLVADGMVAQVEQAYLLDDLQALSQAMMVISLAQLQATQASPWGEAVEEAAWRNLAFFSIGSRLLDPGFAVPPAVAAIVAEEVFLIEQAQAFFISPLTGQQQNYEQFRPPGRYAEEDRAARYFRAIIWYGGTPFKLNAANPAQARLAARQLLLIAAGLESGQNMGRWQRLWQLAGFFYGAGGPDPELSWSVPQVAAVARAVYADLPGVVDLADQSQLDSFIVTMQTLPLVGGEEGESDRVVAPASFRFLPERSQPDAFYLEQLIFNRVGVYRPEDGSAVDEAALPFTAVPTAIGPVRAFPRGLDLAALFGSQRALALLSDGGDTAYDGYRSQLTRLQEQARPWDQTAWTQTLAGGWLYSLEALLAEPAPAPFAFMNSPGWLDRQLNSWFGAWVELRRRVAPVGAAVSGGQDLAPRPAAALGGSVEPQPLLYARLAALAAQSNQVLVDNGLAEEEIAANLLLLEQLLLSFKTISEKELQAEPLTAVEAVLLRQTRQHLLALVSTAARTAAPSLAAVSTVHYDPHSDQVVQVAVGEAWRLYVITWLDGETVIAVGAVYSTYEFKRPASGRLSSSDWQRLDPRPPWPEWAIPYVAP